MTIVKAASLTVDNSQAKQVLDETEAGLNKVGAAAEKNTARLRSYSREWQAVERSIPGSTANLERFAAAERAAARAVQEGRVSKEQAEAALERLRQKYAQADAATNAAARAQEAAARAAMEQARAVEALRGAMDPAYAAASRFAAKQQEVIDLYQAGALNGRQFAQAMKFVADSFDPTVAAAKAQQAALEALRRQYDPTYAAAAKLREEMQRAETVLANSNLSEVERARILHAVAAAHDPVIKAQQRLAETGQQAAGVAGHLRGQMQNLAWQGQDIAVQLSAGTNPLIVFIQQAPQILSGFGAVGAVLGLAAAAAGALALALGGVNGEEKRAKELADAHAKTRDALNVSLGQSATSVDDLAARYRNLNAEMRKVEEAALIAAQRAEAAEMAKLRATVPDQLSGLRDSQAWRDAEYQRRLNDLGPAAGEAAAHVAELARVMALIESFEQGGSVPALVAGFLDVAAAGGPMAQALREAAAGLSDDAVKANELSAQSQKTAAFMAMLKGDVAGAAAALNGFGDEADRARGSLSTLQQVQARASASFALTEAGLRKEIEALKGGEEGLKAYNREKARSEAYTKAYNDAIRSGETALDAIAEGNRIAALAVEKFDLEQTRATRSTASATKANDDAKEIADELADSIRAEADTLREADRIRRSVMTPMERYAEEQARLNDLLDQGYISQDTYNRALAAADPAYRQAEQAAADYQREVDRAVSGTTDRVVDYAGDAFADLFADTKGGWEEVWDDMGRIARQTLARIAAEAIIRPVVQPIVAEIVGSAPSLFGIQGAGQPGMAAGGGGVGIGSLIGGGTGVGGFDTSWLSGSWLDRQLGGGLTSVNNWLNTPMWNGPSPSMMSGIDSTSQLGYAGAPGPTWGNAIGSVGYGINAFQNFRSGNVVGGIGNTAAAAMMFIPGAQPFAPIVAIGSQLLGGLFGNQKPSNKEGGSTYDFATDEYTSGGQTGKKFSQANRDAAAQIQKGMVDVAEVLETFAKSKLVTDFYVGVGDRDGARVQRGAENFTFAKDEAGIASAVDWLTGKWADELSAGLGPTMTEAIKKIDFSDLQSGLSDLQFLSDLKDAQTALSEFDRSLAGIQAAAKKAALSGLQPFLDQIDKAGDLGVKTEYLTLAKGQLQTYLDTLANPVDWTATEQALAGFRGQMDALRKVSEDAGLGMAAAIDAAEQAGLARMRRDAGKTFDAAITEAEGRGYINQLNALNDALASNTRDLTALGMDTGRAATLYTAQVKGILSGLNASELALVADTYTGGLKTLATQMRDAAIEAEKAAAAQDALAKATQLANEKRALALQVAQGLDPSFRQSSANIAATLGIGAGSWSVVTGAVDAARQLAGAGKLTSDWVHATAANLLSLMDAQQLTADQAQSIAATILQAYQDQTTAAQQYAQALAASQQAERARRQTTLGLEQVLTPGYTRGSALVGYDLGITGPATQGILDAIDQARRLAGAGTLTAEWMRATARNLLDLARTGQISTDQYAGIIDELVKAYQSQTSAAQAVAESEATIHRLRTENAQAAIQTLQSQIGAAEQAESAWRSTYDSIRQFRLGLLTSDLSPLSPQERMDEALRQYRETLALAQGGDQDAAGRLQGLAQAALEAARGFYASSSGYADIFAEVQSGLSGVETEAERQVRLQTDSLSTLRKQLETQEAMLKALQQPSQADLAPILSALNAGNLGDLVDWGKRQGPDTLQEILRTADERLGWQNNPYRYRASADLAGLAIPESESLRMLKTLGFSGDRIDYNANAFLAARDLGGTFDAMLRQWARDHGIPGYATGTLSAASGPAWVGENGPELMWMRGGETIMPHAQSMAWERASSWLRPANDRWSGPAPSRPANDGGGSAATVAELRELRREVAELRKASVGVQAASGQATVDGLSVVAGETRQVARAARRAGVRR